MKNITVYVIPVDAAYDYVLSKYPGDEEKKNDFVTFVNDEMTEDECWEVVDKARTDGDGVADVMTLREFQGNFNYDLDDKIKPSDYLIKFFLDGKIKPSDNLIKFFE